nr:hypothetical protein [Tanacetum cinerariifolium]
MLLQEWVEVSFNTQPNRECSCQPGRFVLNLEVEIELKRRMKMFKGEGLKSVHAFPFAWDAEDLGKLVERNNNLIVSNDEGKGNGLVDISSDLNTLEKFKDKQRTKLFIDIQKTIKIDGREDLANGEVIE